jgi:xanthine dehydrogenase accessory factor
MIRIFENICFHLEQGKTGALATIIKGIGSTPQGSGAKIFMDEHGSVTGSIGGGCVEAEAWQEAKKIIGSSESRIIRYAMNSTQVADEGMICGGVAEIFIEPVLQKHYDLYKEYLRCLKEFFQCTIITNTGSSYSKSLITADGKILGDFPDDSVLSVLKKNTNEKQLHFLNEFLVEPCTSRNRLFIYGAGHISQFISKIAKMIDFEVTVIDDRISFANRENFPDADNILAGYFTETINQINYSPADFHVIVTRGHRHDAEVLAEVLKKPFAYAGMIGSKRKIKLVYDYLKSNGTDALLIDRVHSPIGIEMSAITPQEIAVSIAGQLIKERALFYNR